MGFEWAEMTTMGPNDARRVRLGPRYVFSLNIRVFHLLTLILGLIYDSSGRIWDSSGQG
jgi:hypothetical protein